MLRSGDITQNLFVEAAGWSHIPSHGFRRSFAMTPAEQNLIEDLFNRIRTHGVAGRDAEADQLIGRLMRDTPDAAYALVQSVLVQDQALREADQRIRSLEERQSAGSSGGSFLGTPDRRRWNPTGPSVQPEPAQPEQTFPRAASSEAGGFMRGALQTAAGVAGGALLFEGVRSLFHSGAGGLGGWGGLAGNPWGNPETVVNETTINETVLNDDRDGDRDNPSGVQSADYSNDEDQGDRDAVDAADFSDDSSGFDDSTDV
jgi:hypothetical protein